MKTDFIQIASYASKAPSGHNTQPWKFHITDSTITVLPNLDERYLSLIETIVSYLLA